MKKDDLLLLMATDELEKTANALLDWAKIAAAAELYSDALIEAGRLAALQKSRIRGNVDEQDLTTQRNDVRVVLLEIIQQLPETPTETAQLQPRGMTETRFKLLVFVVMILGNIAAFICLFVLGEGAGGFSPPEASTTAAMLLSVCTAYFSVMLGEFIAQRNEAKKLLEKRVSRGFLGISLALLTFYFIVVCWLINRRPLMEFQTFINWLTVFESGLGLFVGQIIHSLFKKENV